MQKRRGSVTSSSSRTMPGEIGDQSEEVRELKKRVLCSRKFRKLPFDYAEILLHENIYVKG